MMVLTSPQNPHIKTVRKLADRKYRYELGLFVVEGENLVKDALRFKQKIVFFVCSCSLAIKYDKIIGESDAQCFVVEDNIFSDLCDTVTNQGILAVVAFSAKTLRPPKKNCLLLDGIQDPANVGAILRTAAAAGYSDVYLCDSADPYSAKSIRAGMSAQYVLNIFQGGRQTLLELLEGCCRLICADAAGKSIYDFSPCEKYALVLGNEGNGVSDLVRAKCESTVRIPMENDIESLNVAVSAGILMYLLK